MTLLRTYAAALLLAAVALTACDDSSRPSKPPERQAAERFARRVKTFGPVSSATCRRKAAAPHHWSCTLSVRKGERPRCDVDLTHPRRARAVCARSTVQTGKSHRD